jgi:hypothetical protein
MATEYFDSSALLTDGAVPGIGHTLQHGNSIVGCAALQRVLVQFLSGAPIVDYATLLATSVGNPDGIVDYLDTRAGTQVGTSGTTPNVAETWTLTFTSATAFDVSGSVSGAKVAGVVGTHYVIEDLIGFTVAQGAVNAWVSGDTITFDVITNPNTTQLWTDSDPQNGETIENKRLIFADPVGLADPADYVYSELYFENVTVGEQALGLRGARGYSTDGLHPDTTEWRFVNMWDDAIGFWFSATERRWTGVYLLGSQYRQSYQGFINTFAISTEYAYPHFTMAESNTAQPATEVSSSLVKGWWQAHSLGASGSQAYAPDGQISYVQAGNTTNAPSKPARVLPFASTGGSIGNTNNAEAFVEQLKAPRPGNDQTPLFPVYVTNYLYVPGGSTDISDTTVTATEEYGEFDELYAVSALHVNVGATLTVAGSDYLVIDAVNSPSTAALLAVKIS